MLKFIKKYLFHRIVIVAVGIIVQLLILLLFLTRFYTYSNYFYGFCIALSTIMVLYIIYNKSNPMYKIAWIIPILLFPIFGGFFFLFFGNNRLSKKELRDMEKMQNKVDELYPSHTPIMKELKSQNPYAAQQAKYLHDYALAGVCKNTQTEYFPIGEAMFERLKEELRKAKHYIFMEYFIVEEGVMWDAILEILAEKAKEGLDVRVVYDDAGCLFTLPPHYDKKLESMGIKCCVFNPFKPVLNIRMNNRDHRKITSIDGHTAFTGGLNLADEYINERVKHGHWKDTAIMMKGDAAWNFTLMFLTLWAYLRGTEEDFSKFREPITEEHHYETDGYVLPFTDTPLDQEPVGEIVYLNLINKAKKYVYITTPYLIIDNEMITALSTAAKNGVDVRIITPHHGDSGYVHRVTRSYYPALLESGVKIYEYAPGYIHAKTYCVDDEFAVVGTINMDYRSLYLHFECGVWLYKNSTIQTMKDDYLKTLEVCKRIDLDNMGKYKWYEVLWTLILRAFAPLM